jgi:hypothetical protein
LRDNGFNAQTLIEEIVLSVPFRYQAASSPVAVPTSQRSSSSPTQKEQ